MELKDVMSGMNVKNLIVTVGSVGIIETTGNGIKKQELIVEDRTGTMILVLWEKDAGLFSMGNKLIITGFCKDFEDKVYLTKGKFGHIRVLPPEKP